MAETEATDLSLLTTNVVSAYVANNSVGVDELAALIAATYDALKNACQPVPADAPSLKVDKAAIKKSINSDHLTSFIDGRKYKSLKRHLTAKGLTIADYREVYGLPKDYPMVAPTYSAQRSELAKSLGLGRKASTTSTLEPQASKVRGRTKALKVAELADS